MARDPAAPATEPSPPLRGDSLPALVIDPSEITEATPAPAPGATRDALAAVTDERAAAAETAFTAALSTYLDRLRGVTLSRMGGPRARKDTRWWREQRGGVAPEVKAVDPGYVLPAKLVDEAADAIRPVALRVAYDEAADTARRLGVSVPDATGDGMFAIDHQALARAVEDAVAEVMNVARHHAAQVREAILRADSSADSLDEVLAQIEEAHRRGGGWVLMAGRTLANALLNDAALTQARALGVTHGQWLSRRDPRVRPTHRIADGQMRALGETYRVGEFALRFPCDPTDLPRSWPEVAGCRCRLLFRPPDADVRRDLRVMRAGERAGRASLAAERLLRAARSAPEVPAPTGAPVGAGAHRATTTESVVAYRLLSGAVDAVAGQLIVLSGAPALGLAAPLAFTAAVPVLTVLIPVGTVVTVVAGAVMLDAGTPLEVLGSGPTGIQATVAR